MSLHKIPHGQVILIAASHYLVIAVYGSVKNIDAVRIDAAVGGDKMFVDLFADIENTPVLSIQIDVRGTKSHDLRVHNIFTQILHKSIAEQSAVPVIAAVTQNQTLKMMNILVRKNLIIDLARVIHAALKNGQGFLIPASAPAAKYFDTDIQLKSKLAVRLVKGHVQRPLPVLPEIGAKIGIVVRGAVPFNQNTIIIVVQIEWIRGQTDDGKGRILVHNKSVGDNPARQQRRCQGSRTNDRGSRDGNRRAVNVRILIRLRAVKCIINRAAAGVGQRHEQRGIIKTALRRHDRGCCFAHIERILVFRPRGGPGKQPPIRAAIRDSAVGNIHGQLWGFQAVKNLAVAVDENQAFPAALDFKVGV